MKKSFKRDNLPIKTILLVLFVCLYILCIPVSVYALDSSELRLPDEKKTLGKNVPNVKLFDSGGKTFFLKDIMDNKPLFISPIYTRCTTACFTITDTLRDVVEKTGGLGRDFNVMSLSFDARDTHEDLEKFRKQWDLDGKTWVIASGEEAEVKKLLNSIDFRYIFDSGTNEFLHPNVTVALTPDGRISRYLHGAMPKERDMRLTVMEAKRGASLLGPLDGFYLRCFRFDNATGTFKTDWIFLGQIITGVITILTIFLAVFGRDLYALIFRKKNILPKSVETV